MAKENLGRMTHYFLVPVFNEELNIPTLHKEIVQVLPGLEKFYVFVDDGSTDNTVKLLNELFAGHNFVVLGDGSNHGPGMAFNTGFEWVLDNSTDGLDKIITLEGDNTSSLEILSKMVAVSNAGFDLVLASVYAQGGGFDQTTFMRKLLSFAANQMFRFIFDIKILTLSSFYRIYNVSLVRGIKQKYEVIIDEKGFICMLEILIKAIRLDASIIEVPMKLYSKKRAGKSKMKVFKTFVGYMKFLFRKGRKL
jgi:dolichol-phosphate mannosyltransferase